MRNTAITIFILTAFTIVNIGCAKLGVLGQPTEQQGEDTEGEVAAESVAEKTLPEKEKTLPEKADSSASMRHIENAVKRLETRNREGKLSLDELRKQARRRLHGVMITGCELAHLKALIVANRTPFVILKPSEGKEHLRAVAAYQDADKKIKLLNPLQKGTEEMEYSAFEQAWQAASTPTSALILSVQAISADTVKNMLITYFTEDKLANLNIK